MLAATGMGIGFVIAFVIFAIALVGLLVFIAVWAIRNDAASRKEWENEGQTPETP